MFKKVFLLCILIGTLISPLIIFAEDSVDNLQDKIQEYSQKINELRNRANTLEGEVEYMDNQIGLTEAQIQNSQFNINKTQEQIEKLTVEIDDLVMRIERLADSINYQRDLLNNRTRERYKTREITPFMVIFGSSTFNTLIQKAAYLKQIELQDKKLLDEMEHTKKSYDTQKDIFESKRKEEEELKAQLVQEKANLDAYKYQLDNQKHEKERLLEITQNDESKYKNLLAEAEKELQQISGAVGVLKYQDGEKVDKGDLIGYQGNTGYSFGEHLHFGVYRYSSFEDIDGWNWYYSNYVNPKDVLKRKTVYWNTGCESPGNKETGNGDWAWPISTPTVSQGFGYTCWSDRFYNGNPHPAYDMYGAYGSPVYAAEDGEAYFCRNCLGDGGNGVFIFHDDNYMSVYWHLR